MEKKQAKQTNVSTTDKLKFGKHKGRVVSYILKVDPKYLSWLKNQGIVEFNEYLNKLL